MFAAERDRDRASATLRQQYVDGRLTLDELAHRTDLVLTARSRAELRSALSGLPWLGEALAAQGRSAAQAVVRGVVLAVFTGAYLLFSFALLAVLGLTVLFQGASGSALLGFLVVWLVPTFLVSRMWHRRPPGRRPST